MALLSDYIGEGKNFDKVYGVFIATVKENKDEQHMGMVKIEYPWREEGKYSWARVAMPMSGENRGIYFMPEIDDEVLVAFEEGDINRPYVIGSLWNGIDKAPRADSDVTNDIKRIKTRSGHELIFDDKGGIEIKTKTGGKITITDSSISIDAAVINLNGIVNIGGFKDLGDFLKRFASM